MGRSVAEILKQLKEDNPEALADIKKIIPSEIDITKVDKLTIPSEIKKLAESIKSKRLNGEPLSKEELKNLMRRIGK